MNFQLVTNFRHVPLESIPVHHRDLPFCLRCLGVPKTRYCGKTYFNQNRAKTEPSVMWHLLECAKRNYRNLVKMWHPDRQSGNHDRMAFINACYDRVVELFRRNGYELA